MSLQLAGSPKQDVELPPVSGRKNRAGVEVPGPDFAPAGAEFDALGRRHGRAQRSHSEELSVKAEKENHNLGLGAQERHTVTLKKD